MEKRYTALRIIATLYKIVAVIMAILVVIGVLFTIFANPFVIDFGSNFFGRSVSALSVITSIIVAVLEIVFGGLGALGVYAVGELLYLMINIEENTRFTALIIRDRMGAVPPPPPPQPVQPVVPPPAPTYTPPAPPYTPPPPVETPPTYMPPE